MIKKTLIILIAILFINDLQASDILILKNNLKYAGEIKKIKSCRLHFSIDGSLYVIPLDSVSYLGFEDAESEVVEYILSQQDENCMRGRMDAPLHGRAPGNVALGFFFGPFGILGCILGSPNPHRGQFTSEMSRNRELFNDPTYLLCYRRAQRGRAAGHAAIGWGVWIMIVLLYNSGA